ARPVPHRGPGRPRGGTEPPDPPPDRTRPPGGRGGVRPHPVGRPGREAAGAGARGWPCEERRRRGGPFVNRQHSESQKRLDPGPTPAHLPSDPGLAASPGEEGFDLDEVLAKYDRESAFRRLAGPVGRLIALVLIGFSLFQLYTAAFGVLDARIQRAIHLAFGMSLVFLLYPARKGGSRTSLPWWDVLLAVASAAVSLYLVVFYHEIVMRAGMPTTADLVVATLAVLLVLEAARRVVGLPIVIIAGAFLVYALVGRQLPGFLAHRGYSFSQIANHMYFTTEGIFGLPLGVSATFIFLFILFGAFLEKTGIGRFFIDLANAVAGFASGGPA